MIWKRPWRSGRKHAGSTFDILAPLLREGIQMWKLFSVAATALFITGCSTSPISSGEASKIPPSRIYAFSQKAESQLVVTRDTGILGAACNYKIYIDGKLAAEIGSGETVAFGLRPGNHILGIAAAAPCGGAGLRESDVTIASGETAKRRVYTNSSGFFLTPTAF